MVSPETMTIIHAGIKSYAFLSFLSHYSQQFRLNTILSCPTTLSICLLNLCKLFSTTTTTTTFLIAPVSISISIPISISPPPPQMRESASSKCCLFLECAESVLRERLRHRAETSGRVDDNEESIIKRFRTYNEETLPICKKFEELGQLRRVCTPFVIF